jgi:dTDP-4-amino-4,6-dideoxygalactose transaminase
VKQFAGRKHALAMPTARTGIYLTIKAIIKPGQKVIMSPITIVDVINMVLCAGGIPVFADTDADSCNIDPVGFEDLIDNETGLVFVTHLHGLACDMDKIREICKRKNVPLVEDSAQAFSTLYKGRRTGSLSDAAVFSFGMYKNVNSFFGGMIVLDDDALYEKIRKEADVLTDQGKSHLTKKMVSALQTDIGTWPALFKVFTYWIFRFAYLKGIKSINNITIVDLHPERYNKMPKELLRTMLPVQARLALTQLGNVDEDNAVRIRHAKMYYEGLKDIPELVLPPMREDGSHIYTYYALQFPDRLDFMRYAMKSKRDFVICHYHNCADLEIFKDFYRDCPLARKTAGALIYLPTYPRYTPRQVQENIRVIRKYFNKQPQA